MDLEKKFVEITAENIDKHPQVICYINPKHELYHLKIDWIIEQLKYGLKIKLLYIKGEKKPIGFIEYIPGEYCWRSVNAKGYMFIHCLWINGNKHKQKGIGTYLIEEVEKDAKNMLGVAVLSSDKAFMANKEIFLKKGYKKIAESGKEQLLVKKIKEGNLPTINDWESELKKYQGLTFLYSKQCPWVARFIEEVKPILKKENLAPEIIEIKTAAEAQNAPSIYSVFNIIYKGKILTDRYISTTRFLNIVKKELR